MKFSMELIRMENRQAIKNAFKKVDMFTASQISKLTKISTVTVNSILLDMIKCGEVSVKKHNSVGKKGGRPSNVYIYNRKYICSGIIYAYENDGKILINSIVTDAFTEIIFKENHLEKKITNDLMYNIYSTMIEQNPTVKSITFGFPGVQTRDGIIFADFAVTLNDKFLKKISAENIDLYMVNDINAIIYGRYANTDISSAVGIYFPVNYTPGAGIIVNNELYTGNNGFAGEIKDIPVKHDWLSLNEKSSGKISKQIYSLLMVINCVLAPQEFVLYGEYINTDIIIKLNEKIKAEALDINKPLIVQGNSFDGDFLKGLLCITEDKISEYYLTMEHSVK